MFVFWLLLFLLCDGASNHNVRDNNADDDENVMMMEFKPTPPTDPGPRQAACWQLRGLFARTLFGHLNYPGLHFISIIRDYGLFKFNGDGDDNNSFCWSKSGCIKKICVVTLPSFGQ